MHQRKAGYARQLPKCPRRRKLPKPLDIDARIARITQMMAETRAELEQVEYSSDRTIAVASGTIRKLHREHARIEAETSNLIPLRRRHPGSLTARNIPRLLTPVDAPATARRSDDNELRPYPPAGPSNQEIGVVVRKHLQGDGMDCWDDILLSCHQTAADDLRTTAAVSNTVQNVIANDERLLQPPKQRRMSLDVAVTILLGFAKGADARTKFRAARLRGTLKIDQTNSPSLEQLNKLYGNPSPDPLPVAHVPVMATEAFIDYDQTRHWPSWWIQLKAQMAPAVGSHLGRGWWPTTLQVAGGLHAARELVSDQGMTADAVQFGQQLICDLLHMQKELEWMESSDNGRYEISLEAIFGPLRVIRHPASCPKASSSVKLISSQLLAARKMERVFDDPLDEQARIRGCEDEVKATVTQLVESNNLMQAADLAVACEQLGLERHKMMVAASIDRVQQSSTQLINCLNAQGFESVQLSQIVLHKKTFSRLLTEQQEQAYKLEGREKDLHEAAKSMITLQLQLNDTLLQLQNQTLCESVPTKSVRAVALVASARLAEIHNSRGRKIVAISRVVSRTSRASRAASRSVSCHNSPLMSPTTSCLRDSEISLEPLAEADEELVQSETGAEAMTEFNLNDDAGTKWVSDEGINGGVVANGGADHIAGLEAGAGEVDAEAEGNTKSDSEADENLEPAPTEPKEAVHWFFALPEESQSEETASLGTLSPTSDPASPTSHGSDNEEPDSPVSSPPVSPTITTSITGVSEVPSMGATEIMSMKFDIARVIVDEAAGILLEEPDECDIDALERVHSQIGTQLEELLELKNFQAARSAAEVLAGLDELMFSKCITAQLAAARKVVGELTDDLLADSRSLDPVELGLLISPAVQKLIGALSALLDKMHTSWLGMRFEDYPREKALQPEDWTECLGQSAEIRLRLQTTDRSKRAERYSPREKALSQSHKVRSRALRLIAIFEKGLNATVIVQDTWSGIKPLVRVAGSIGKHLTEALTSLARVKDSQVLKKANESVTRIRRLMASGAATHLSFQAVALHTQSVYTTLDCYGYDEEAGWTSYLHDLALKICEHVLTSHHQTVMETIKADLTTASTAIFAETAHLAECKQFCEMTSTAGAFEQLSESIYKAAHRISHYQHVLSAHNALTPLSEAIHTGLSVALRPQLAGFTAKASQVLETMQPLKYTFHLPLIDKKVKELIADSIYRIHKYKFDCKNKLLQPNVDQDSTRSGEGQEELSSVLDMLGSIMNWPTDQRSLSTVPSLDDWNRLTPQMQLTDLWNQLAKLVATQGNISVSLRCKAMSFESQHKVDEVTIAKLAAEILSIRMKLLQKPEEPATAESADMPAATAESADMPAATESADTTEPQTAAPVNEEILANTADLLEALRGDLEYSDQQQCTTMRGSLQLSLDSMFSEVQEQLKRYQSVDQNNLEDEQLLFSSHKEAQGRHLIQLRGAKNLQPNRRQGGEIQLPQGVPQSPKVTRSSKIPHRRDMDVFKQQLASDGLRRKRKVHEKSQVATPPIYIAKSQWNPMMKGPDFMDGRPVIFGWLYDKRKYPKVRPPDQPFAPPQILQASTPEQSADASDQDDEYADNFDQDNEYADASDQGNGYADVFDQDNEYADASDQSDEYADDFDQDEEYADDVDQVGPI